MPSKGMSEYAKRWHYIRREQRRLEEPFIVKLLESTTPDDAPGILSGLTDDAIEAIRFQLQVAHPDYWADIRYHNCNYDFDPGSTDETERRERFAATVAAILAALDNRV